MRRMRVKSGAVGLYQIESDDKGKSFKYFENKWDSRTLRDYILIVEVVEKDEEIPKELYAKASTFNRVYICLGGFGGFFTWARLCEIIDKRTGDITQCKDEGLENWYMFNQKHLTSRGVEVSEKDKADRLEVQKIWDEFKCELEPNVRCMIYGNTGAEWCVAVRSECKEKSYKGSSYCPCLRAHPSSGNFHCIHQYLKNNNLRPNAELSIKEMYKILGDR